MRKSLIALSLSALVVLGLAGCSGDGKDGAKEPAKTTISVTAIEIAAANPSAGPVVTLESGDNGVLTIGGSSSCPPEVESAKLKGETVTFKVKELPEGKACTMDFVPFSFNFSLNEGSKDTFAGKTFEVLNQGETVTAIVP